MTATLPTTTVSEPIRTEARPDQRVTADRRSKPQRAARVSHHYAPTNLRMRLKEAHRSCGYVQGAWWPRSTVLAVELPPLLSGLTQRFGRLDAVEYHPDDWSSDRPMWIEHQGRPIDIDPVERMPHMLSVTGPGVGRLALLVVPPYTDPHVAYDAVSAAADPDNTSTPEELLGDYADGAAAQRDLLYALQKWECEGGQ